MPKPKSTPEERRKVIVNLTDHPSKDGLLRRTKSIAFLQAHSIPLTENLPVLRDSASFKPRSKEEILDRSFALAAVALKGEGLEKEHLDKFVKKFGVDMLLTPEESVFFRNATPTASESSKFSWRYESLYVFFWSLGLVDNLPIPRAAMDIGPVIALMRDKSRTELLALCKPRSSDEILDQADLAYRYHWALIEVRENPKARPTQLNSDVVMEWHHALNWLIRYMDDEWDNVSTDT